MASPPQENPSPLPRPSPISTPLPLPPQSPPSSNPSLPRQSPPSSNPSLPSPETSSPLPPPPSTNPSLTPPETSSPLPPPPSTNPSLPLPLPAPNKPRSKPSSKKPSPVPSPPLSPSQTLAIVIQPDYLHSNSSNEPNSNNLTIGSLLTMSDLTMAKVLNTPTRLPRTVRMNEMRRMELGLRVSAMVLCVISFAFMAADSVPGWDGDSFNRYNEYIYLLSINVIGCTYSIFQVIDEIYQSMKGKHFISHPIGSCFNLCMDQILSYLLLSASSASTSQISIWIWRFGSDDFTKMVNASVSVSFFAFLVFAMSSVFSARNLFSSVS